MRRAYLIATAVISLICGCTPQACNDPEFAVGKAFFRNRLPESQFATYNLEDQYSIYMYMNGCVHPPLMQYADLLAANGPAVVGLLKKKLVETNNTFRAAIIVLVFNVMNRNKNYDVLGDRELMNFLQASLDRLPNDGWRDLAQEWLNDIAVNRELR